MKQKEVKYTNQYGSRGNKFIEVYASRTKILAAHVGQKVKNCPQLNIFQSQFTRHYL